MDFFVNDVSLHGQFANPQAFRQSLDLVLLCQRIILRYKCRLLISRTIKNCKVCGNQTLPEAVRATRDRDFIRVVMLWIDRNGPFFQDEQIGSPGEYLALPDGEVVTDIGPGAAAFQQFQGHDTSLISFAPSNFTYTPVEIRWHRNDDDVVSCELLNFWTAQGLDDYLQRKIDLPKTWNEMIDQLPSRFPNLDFLPDLEQYLRSEPFSPYIVERVFVLLGVLNRLKECFDERGQRTQEGEALLDNYFRRANARFSDASESEKNDPHLRKMMIFRAPDGRDIECFWHGKINSPQYRIHFTYPITADQPLYIAYIGPKLTKR